MNILIRADAGTLKGLGHVMRCIALAAQCVARGHSTTLLSRDLPVELKIEATRYGIYVEDISFQDKEAEIFCVVSRAEVLSCKWLVLDGYEFDASYQRAYRSAGLRVLTIDDLGTAVVESNLVLNQNAGSEFWSSYSYGAGSQLLLGSSYVLLRPPFMSSASRVFASGDEASKILITLGGAADLNLVARILLALNMLRERRLEIRVVVGLCSQLNDDFNSILREVTHNVSVITSKSDLSEQMLWADLAITAAGSTVWELCALKCPMVLGTVADNQRPLAQVLEQRGAAISIGDWLEVDAVKIADSVRKALGDIELRRGMSLRAGLVCDGQGAVRVVEQMERIS